MWCIWQILILYSITYSTDFEIHKTVNDERDWISIFIFFYSSLRKRNETELERYEDTMAYIDILLAWQTIYYMCKRGDDMSELYICHWLYGWLGAVVWWFYLRKKISKILYIFEIWFSDRKCANAACWCDWIRCRRGKTLR